MNLTDSYTNFLRKLRKLLDFIRLKGIQDSHDLLV